MRLTSRIIKFSFVRVAVIRPERGPTLPRSGLMTSTEFKSVVARLVIKCRRRGSLGKRSLVNDSQQLPQSERQWILHHGQIPKPLGAGGSCPTGADTARFRTGQWTPKDRALEIKRPRLSV